MASKKPTLLVDADLIVYRSCVAVEKDVRFEDNYHLLYSDFDDAWPNVELAFTRLFEKFGTTNHVAALSEGRNFRYDIDPTYKGNRKDVRKPLCFWRVREELEKQYRVIKFDGLEADDVLGILATRDANTVICSEDKDLKTIPGTLYRAGVVQNISLAEADLNWMTQTLTGDVADGYPGCKGVGEVKAAKILTPSAAHLLPPCIGSMWPLVRDAFIKAGLTEEDALIQARLARILRNSDWDGKNKRPILWTP